MRIGVVAALIGVFCVVLVPAASAAATNGGFETGDTSGWTATGPGVITVPSGGAAAGTYYAQLTTENNCCGGAPGPGATLTQTVTLAAGEAVTGWAEWQGGDCSYMYDAGIVSVGGTPVWTGDCFGPLNTWTQWTFVAPSAGSYAITAHIVNTSDDFVSSSMGLDAVSTSGGSASGASVKCWNDEGNNGCAQYGHVALCDPLGHFLNVEQREWSSAYADATPAAYVQGYGLMCSLSNLVTYGGDPSGYVDSGYRVDQTGGQNPAESGLSDADFGAYYEFFKRVS